MIYYYLLEDGTYISTTDTIHWGGNGNHIEEIYCDQMVIDSYSPDRLDERISDNEWTWILLKAKPIKIN
jgi:hypothetical protein